MNSKPELSIFQNTQTHPDGTLVICGTALMVIPAGGKHVRQVDVQLPPLAGTPTISVTVHCVEQGGVPKEKWKEKDFVIYDVTFHPETGYFGCKISATNIWKGVNSDLQFVCNYIAIGKAPA